VDPLLRPAWKQAFKHARDTLRHAYRQRTHQLLSLLTAHGPELRSLSASPRPHFLVRLTFACVAVLLGSPRMGWSGISPLLGTAPTPTGGRVALHYSLLLAGPMDACDCFSLSPSCVSAVVGLVTEKDFDTGQIHRQSPAAFLVLEWVCNTRIRTPEACAVILANTITVALKCCVPCAASACVTLLLHCCYTVVTLLLHCCYTVVTLLLHCSYTVLTLFFHCSGAVYPALLQPVAHAAGILRRLHQTRGTHAANSGTEPDQGGDHASHGPGPS
jgi:hypothetical protein